MRGLPVASPSMLAGQCRAPAQPQDDERTRDGVDATGPFDDGRRGIGAADGLAESFERDERVARRRDEGEPLMISMTRAVG